jgi:hypothetical protein
VNRRTIVSFASAGFFCLGLLSFGCSSDSSSSPPADAGKKDTGAGTGGKGGGAGGSSDTGGATGTGGNAGSSGKGGATSAGGSSGTGGSNATGGSAGAAGAGSGGTAGAIGGAAGGGSGGGVDSGAGGSTGGTGGTTVVDGGHLDGSGDDAIDAPMPPPDGSLDADASSPDVIGPVILDGALDQGSVDVEAVDTTVVRLDAELDTEKLDVVVDVTHLADAADVSAAACLQQIVSNGYAAGSASCADCKETNGALASLTTQCRGMVDCLVAAACVDQNGSCWLTCRNAVSGDQPATAACVSNMMTAASCP